MVPERLQPQIGALLTDEVEKQKRKIGFEFFILFYVLLDENLHFDQRW